MTSDEYNKSLKEVERLNKIIRKTRNNTQLQQAKKALDELKTKFNKHHEE